MGIVGSICGTAPRLYPFACRCCLAFSRQRDKGLVEHEFGQAAELVDQIVTNVSVQTGRRGCLDSAGPLTTKELDSVVNEVNIRSY